MLASVALLVVATTCRVVVAAAEPDYEKGKLSWTVYT